MASFISAARPEFALDAHDSTINTLQQSPFDKNIFLTVGGWTFSIWKNGLTVSSFVCLRMRDIFVSVIIR